MIAKAIDLSAGAQRHRGDVPSVYDKIDKIGSQDSIVRSSSLE